LPDLWADFPDGFLAGLEVRSSTLFELLVPELEDSLAPVELLELLPDPEVEDPFVSVELLELPDFGPVLPDLWADFPEGFLAGLEVRSSTIFELLVPELEDSLAPVELLELLDPEVEDPFVSVELLELPDSGPVLPERRAVFPDGFLAGAEVRSLTLFELLVPELEDSLAPVELLELPDPEVEDPFVSVALLELPDLRWLVPEVDDT